MTTTRTKADQIQRQWHLVDFDGLTLGRTATLIARLLTGKDKPNYEPHLDIGDYVVVINCQKLKTTGHKLDNKLYYRHSGYIGNLKKRTMSQMMERDSRIVVKKAVSGMLAKNKLRARRLTRLKLFPNKTHDYSSKFKD